MTNSILLFLTAIISGSLAFVFRQQIKKFIPGILSFSGAYLLSICFLHLLPDLFEKSYSFLGIYILIGFFLQLILDYFSGGIEHGHTHVNKKRMKKVPFLVLISLCLHAFLESIPIHHIDAHEALGNYQIGLMIHKAPIAFILISLLIAYELNRISIIICLILFASIAPIAYHYGIAIEAQEELFSALMAISVGIILHLSTTILLETNEEHTIHWRKLIPMILGVGLGLLTLLQH